jgi:hypothetical protein
MKTIAEVRSKIVSMLGAIRRLQGYENDFQPSHIHKGWNKQLAESGEDKNFPKTFVITEKQTMQRGIGDDVIYTLDFLIIHIVKAIAKSDDVIALLESAENDFTKFIEDNDRLGNFVNNADLVELVVDDGVLKPEGVLIMRIRTERSKHGTP